MSLLQTRHLSVPDTAFNPPQLPLMFLPINITPSDIRMTTSIKKMNVNIKVIIVFLSNYKLLFHYCILI